MVSGFFHELKDRGLIHQTTDEVALEKQLNEETVIYMLVLTRLPIVYILVIYFPC